ncbi:hypothetical protein SANTM175S_03469 [Streptomyces antimycoticus]
MWTNYARRGYRRLIYTNTLSVVPEATGMFERAMGSGVRIVRVLLTATSTTARERLERREIGSELETEWESSTRTSAGSGPADPRGRGAGGDGRAGCRGHRARGGGRHRLGRAALPEQAVIRSAVRSGGGRGGLLIIGV